MEKIFSTIVVTALVANDCNIFKPVKDSLLIGGDTAGIVEDSLHTCPHNGRY